MTKLIQSLANTIQFVTRKLLYHTNDHKCIQLI